MFFSTRLSYRRVFPHLVYSQFANGGNDIQTPRQHRAMLRSHGQYTQPAAAVLLLPVLPPMHACSLHRSLTFVCMPRSIPALLLLRLTCDWLIVCRGGRGPHGC
jgi:hypothetical protein